MPSSNDVVIQARPGKSVVGWKLDRAQRREMLAHIVPHYSNVVADHVTLAAKVARETPLPDPVEAQAVGQIDDGRGVQALVVAVAGSTDRPGGGIYHITWSLGPGRQAKESNDALAAQPWQPLGEAIDLVLEPTRWP